MVRRAKSVDSPDDHADEYLMLDDQPRVPQTPGRRQPPPPPRVGQSKFNRPPPPLPVGPQEDESNLQTIINLSELEKCAELGQGEFGSVLRGVWRNPNGAAVSISTFVEMFVNSV